MSGKVGCAQEHAGGRQIHCKLSEALEVVEITA